MEPISRSLVTAPTKADILHNLKQLMSVNKNELENGVVPLCLTPEVLLILNHGFEHLTDTRNGNGKMYKDLSYLQQALSSTQYLRLSHGGTTTIQSPVDLSSFHHLSQLDVKRVPPHWIVGLNKFKDKMVLIRMSRCINFLEDILGKSSDSSQIVLTWNRLKKLYLSNNFIRNLDDSLKLLPCLEVLDISQNYLTQAAHYLQHLTELVHVNLAYNSLTIIPTFSSSTCQKLKTLVLRANHLEHITGIDALSNLETVDLTSNVLCDHGVLYPLYSLPALKQLFLDDNPLSCNSRHRILTAASLSRRVVKQLSLDGQVFSETEMKLSSSLRANIRPPPESSSEPNPLFDDTLESSVSTRVSQKKVRQNLVNEINEIPQPSDDVASVLSTPAATASVSVDIVDSELTHEGSPERPHGINLTKTRIETLREEFGDSWLQSFNSCGVSSRRQSYKQTPTTNSLATEAPADAAAESSQPITAQEDGDVTGSEEPQSEYGSVANEGDEVMKENGLDDSESKCNSIEEPGSKDGSVYNTDDQDDEDNQLYGSVGATDHDTDNESTFSTENCEQDDTDGDHCEYDPFIVKLTDIDSEEFLISITNKQIIEKSIVGTILGMLDLSALLDIQPVEQEGRHLVKCKFDYFRKDRRERCYVMEDLNDSMRLVDILQPALARTQSIKKSTDTIECLKCGKQFMLKNTSKRRGRMDCIHCGSDMVIEIGPSLHFQSTPYGSQNSSLSTSPAASKSKTLPKNLLSSNDNSSSSSLYLSLADEEYFPILLANGERSRSGTDATDSTLEAGVTSSGQVISGGDGEEVRHGVGAEEANGRVRLIVGTPDSTVSYQSLEEGFISDNSAFTDDQPDDQTESHTYEVDPLTHFRFDSADLSYIDHRLKLHLTVTYFDDNEQPECIVRCKYVAYAKPEECPVLLILTNLRLYVLRPHTAINRRLDAGAQLELVEKRLLSDILYIEIGLSHQNIRVEFEKSGYCFLLRDSDLGRQLHSNITMMLSGSAFNERSKLKSILKINQEYYEQIGKCLPDITRSEDGQSIIALYTAAFRQQISSDNCNIDLLEGCEAVSLVTDDTTLYILKEKYHLPFTRKRLLKKQSYFTVDNAIPIGDIAHLNVRRDRCEMDIQGFEDQSLEFLHKLVFVSPASLIRFIDALKTPWKDLYDVDLEINFIS